MNINKSAVLCIAVLAFQAPLYAIAADGLPDSDLPSVTLPLQVSSVPSTPPIFPILSATSSTISDAPPVDSAATLPQLVEKNWWGALTEITTVLVIGELLYKTSEESMEGDFDYEIEGGAGQYFAKRIVSTESWKLDDNDIGMNWGHAYAGALYYQAFRNYNFNYYESMLGNFIASGIWEVFAEYKEVVSINDQIVTTFGGSVLGESFFQLGEMLDTKEGWVPATFAAVFNPSRAIRGWFGYNSPNRFDRQKAQDQFDIYTGVLYSTKEAEDISATTMLLGIDASIDSIKGQYDVLPATPSQVELNMELGISQAGVEDWQLSSSLFLGGYTQEVKPMAGSRESWGHSWFVGPSMGIEYSSLGQEDEEDFFAAINVIGLSVGGEWQNADFDISIRGDIFGDFSMVKPFAGKSYRAAGGQFWGTKSVLWEGGYAYGLGHTAKIKLEASYRELLLGLKVTSQRWDSIDDKEFNRSSDWNPNKSDLDFKDARDRYEVYLGVPISKSFEISVHYERIDRNGTLTGIDNSSISFRNDDSENRTSLKLAYQY